MTGLRNGGYVKIAPRSPAQVAVQYSLCGRLSPRIANHTLSLQYSVQMCAQVFSGDAVPRRVEQKSFRKLPRQISTSRGRERAEERLYVVKRRQLSPVIQENART
jgi:hypothetical protein